MLEEKALNDELRRKINNFFGFEVQFEYSEVMHDFRSVFFFREFLVGLFFTHEHFDFAVYSPELTIDRKALKPEFKLLGHSIQNQNGLHVPPTVTVLGYSDGCNLCNVDVYPYQRVREIELDIKMLVEEFIFKIGFVEIVGSVNLHVDVSSHQKIQWRSEMKSWK